MTVCRGKDFHLLKQYISKVFRKPCFNASFPSAFPEPISSCPLQSHIWGRLSLMRCPSSMKYWLYMMTSSNGNIFRVTGPLCGEFTGPGEFPTQRPVTRSFDVFFDLRLNKRLSKHSWGWWFETLSWSLWSHHNDEWILTHLRLTKGLLLFRELLKMSYIKCNVCHSNHGKSNAINGIFITRTAKFVYNMSILEPMYQRTKPSYYITKFRGCMIPCWNIIFL